MILTGKEKHSRNERFNILILSKTDARTKPVSFNIGKKVITAFLTAFVFFIAAISGGLVFLIVRNAQDTQTISALGNQTKEKVALIDQSMREFQKLYNSIFESASNTTKNMPVSPSFETTANSPASEAQEELALKSKYEGKIGDFFTLAAGAQLKETATKAKYRSSNSKVAKVSAQGEVTLTGPGKAVILCTAGKDKKTVCNITCESQFDSVHYLQSDLRWKFPVGIKSRACIASSFAITLENAGIHATPRTVYNTSGLSLNFERLSEKFGIEFVNALSDTSPYLDSFNGGVTVIKNPARNYIAAMKEALGKKPPGRLRLF